MIPSFPFLVFLAQIFFILGDGFLGAYNPPSDLLYNILIENIDIGKIDTSTPSKRRKRRSVLADTSNLIGMHDPTVCLRYREDVVLNCVQ